MHIMITRKYIVGFINGLHIINIFSSKGKENDILYFLEKLGHIIIIIFGCALIRHNSSYAMKQIDGQNLTASMMDDA